MEVIRTFAKFHQTIEPETEIPPPGIFGPAHRRKTPYIYSDQEIQDLLMATQQLKPINGLKPLTFKYLIGLLVTTGLRISEALHLACGDIDFNQGLLIIRETKFHKSRYVPLHTTTLQALQEYILLRDQYEPFQFNSSFFLIDDGKPLKLRQAQEGFKYLRQLLGWSQKPRLYDLRHTFVCRRLLVWYQERKNIDQLMPFLSTYLGHVQVTDTYWYITGIPELMAIVTRRFEQFTQLT
jgi:integrase